MTCPLLSLLVPSSSVNIIEQSNIPGQPQTDELGVDLVSGKTEIVMIMEKQIKTIVLFIVIDAVNETKRSVRKLDLFRSQLIKQLKQRPYLAGWYPTKAEQAETAHDGGAVYIGDLGWHNTREHLYGKTGQNPKTTKY